MPYIVLDYDQAAMAPGTNAGVPNIEIGETFEDIIADIVLGLGNRADVQTGGAYETHLKRWINRGYRATAQMLDIKELWSSVEFILEIDQPFYRVPVALSWIKRAVLQDDVDYFDDGGIEMTMIDEQTYRNLPNSDEIQLEGAVVPPSMYFRYNRMMVVFPTPAAAYTAVVDFRVRPLDLVETTDSPILPEEFHEAIMLAGLMRAQRGLGLRKEAAVTQNDFLSVIRPLINSDAEETDAMHMVAQPVRRRSQLVRGRLF